MLFAWATVAVSLLILTVTLAEVSIEEAFMAVSIALAVPESVAIELALICPEVFVSSVFRSAAERVVSVSVTASLLSPVMPLEL